MFTRKSFSIEKCRLPAGIMLLFFLLSASERNDFPDKPHDRLEWYNKFFPMEKVFLHTDKYIYMAGETIWFKGYITDRTGDRTHLYSNDLYIKLLDQQSGELVYRRYPIVDDMVSGYLVLPRSTLEGKYHLMAYTSWMKNNDPDGIFSKELVVVKNNKRKILADFRLLSGETCITDSLAAVLIIRNQTGEPVADADIAYAIQVGDKTLKQGNSISDPMGIALIRSNLPFNKITGTCFIRFSISSNQGNGRYIFALPVVTGDVELSFHTGNANLLKGHYNKLVVKAVSRFNLPVCCEGEIINKTGKAVMQFKTGINGLGYLSFVPIDDVYKARIITPPGDSLFLLPPVRESGIHIDYLGKNDKTVKFSVSAEPRESSIKTTWIATLSQTPYWSSEMVVSDSFMAEVPLPENSEGLIQVSVFDAKPDLMYEYVVMRKDGNRPLKVVTDKRSYGKRERVTVSVISEENSPGERSLDLSMSVSQKCHAENAYNKNIDEQMIWENRFPTLPYRYGSVDTSAYLQAGKPFPVNWEKIDKYLDSAQERFFNRDGLTGIVYDKRKIAVGYAKVKAINIANWKSYETQCDGSGVFRVLFGSDIIDFNYLNINAFDASGKITLWPTVDQDFASILGSRIAVAEQDMIQRKVADLCKYPYPEIVKTFQYQGKRRKSIVRETRKISSPSQYVNYTGVLDIIRDLKPLDIKNDQIFFKNIPYTYSNQPGALFLVDGLPQGTHVSVINNLTPPDIVYINILTTASEIRRYTSANYPAVIEIITVRGVAQNRMLPGLTGLDILELNRKFYSPDYSSGGQVKHDNRTTLLWSPDLIIPPGKKSFSLSFFTSDIPGIYIIKIQGFDGRGKTLSAEAEFTVKE